MPRNPNIKRVSNVGLYNKIEEESKKSYNRWELILGLAFIAIAIPFMLQLDLFPEWGLTLIVYVYFITGFCFVGQVLYRIYKKRK